MFGRKIHFIGVGGISMSALCRLSAYLGATVTGSDRSDSTVLSRLKSDGYEVYVGTDTVYSDNADIVVYNSAIPTDNPERVKAGSKAVERCEFLSALSENYAQTIAISGTHGKTTTTSMLAAIMQCSCESFSAHIGGLANNWNSNCVINGSRYFITEACEYKRSFLHLNPNIGIILNIEPDHPDCYPDLESLYDAFSKFAKKVKRGGILILGKDVSDKIDISTYENIRIYRYGYNYSIQEIAGESGKLILTAQDVEYEFCVNAVGSHNLYNAGIAALTAILVGKSMQEIEGGLMMFQGVKRRYELIGDVNGAPVISDYAHHPSEVDAVLSVAKINTKGRVILVFEPHTYSRTKSLFNEFCDVLGKSDVLIILPTYAAREKDCDGATAAELYCGVKSLNKYYISEYVECINLIKRIAVQDDTILMCGAGSIETLAEMVRSI